MKIGILTFHYAHNYGAVWQAYALRHVLESMGHKVEIINYRNEHVEHFYCAKINSCSEIKRRKGKIYSPATCREEYQRRERFNKFIKSVLLKDKVQVISLRELEGMDLDVFISGSDQIWTWWLTGGYDRAYLLDFTTKAKKVAYAASMYDTKIPPEKLEYFISALKKYDYISVRESMVQSFLKKQTGVSIERVLDPAFLISEQEYSCLAETVNVTSKYVLVYYLFEDERLDIYAQMIATRMDAVIVELHYVGYKRKRNRIQKSAVSPTEFITYIKNAEYVITNSFHGCVFAIIFKKNFIAVYEEEDRKNNLLSDMGLEDCHIKDGINEVSLPTIDYDRVYERIDVLREHAITFLTKSLQ